MIETFHTIPEQVPAKLCERCSQRNLTQVYEVTLHRDKVTRTWFFCTLECFKKWTKGR